MEFILNGDMTDGPVSVNDIGIINTASFNTEVALICQSEVPGTSGDSDWFIHPDSQSTTDDIGTNNDRGWSRRRGVTSNDFKQVLLFRSSDSVTPLEGRFTCFINGDSNTRSLFILHPSELCQSTTHIF